MSVVQEPKSLATRTPQYQYSEINQLGHIRLMLLQPSQRLEDQVICSLISITLQECVEDIVEHYVAISYVWGDQTSTQTILVDGKSLNITTSLDSALRHVRDGRRVLRVWADGVCINQSSFQDRNLQVSQMGSIYTTATRTIIFLGTSSPDEHLLMESIRARIRLLLYPPKAHSDDSSLDYKLLMLPAVKSAIIARPWFRRLWVLQELVLSSDPWVQCGQIRLRWEPFCEFMLDVDTSDLPEGDAQPQNADNIISINKILSDYKESTETPQKFFLTTLLSRQGARMSDPRDMIYGHLGLINPETRIAIPVDYQKSVEQVYEDVALAFIAWGHPLLLFRLADRCDQGANQEGIPTWVPDWSNLQFTFHDSDWPPNFERSAYKGLTSIKVPHTLAFVSWLSMSVIGVIPNSEGLEDIGQLRHWLTPPTTTKTPYPHAMDVLAILLDIDQSYYTSNKPVLDIITELRESLGRDISYKPLEPDSDFVFEQKESMGMNTYKNNTVEPMLKQWLDVPLIKKHGVDLDRVISDLSDYVQLSRESDQIAFTSRGFVPISSFVQTGDILARAYGPSSTHLSMFWGRSNINVNDHLVFRPTHEAISLESDGLVREDLRKRQAPSFSAFYEEEEEDLLVPDEAPIHHCTFVAYLEAKSTASLNENNPEPAIFAVR